MFAERSEQLRLESGSCGGGVERRGDGLNQPRIASCDQRIECQQTLILWLGFGQEHRAHRIDPQRVIPAGPEKRSGKIQR